MDAELVVLGFPDVGCATLLVWARGLWSACFHSVGRGAARGLPIFSIFSVFLPLVVPTRGPSIESYYAVGFSLAA